MTTKIIAEIGINHNGDIEIAKKLIDVVIMLSCKRGILMHVFRRIKNSKEKIRLGET